MSPYCNTPVILRLLTPYNKTTEESDAGASVGFSPWSAILFPVVHSTTRFRLSILLSL